MIYWYGVKNDFYFLFLPRVNWGHIRSTLDYCYCRGVGQPFGAPHEELQCWQTTDKTKFFIKTTHRGKGLDVPFLREVQFTPLNMSQSLVCNPQLTFGSNFNPKLLKFTLCHILVHILRSHMYFTSSISHCHTCMPVLYVPLFLSSHLLVTSFVVCSVTLRNSRQDRGPYVPSCGEPSANAAIWIKPLS